MMSYRIRRQVCAFRKSVHVYKVFERNFLYLTRSSGSRACTRSNDFTQKIDQFHCLQPEIRQQLVISFSNSLFAHSSHNRSTIGKYVRTYSFMVTKIVRSDDVLTPFVWTRVPATIDRNTFLHAARILYAYRT